MPRVPIYERQVRPDTPNLPQYQAPTIYRAAFGENVARANQNIAQAGMDLAGVLHRRQQEKYQIEQEKYETEVYNKYVTDKQDILYSSDDEDIVVEGQKYTRPKGVLARELGSARGATIDFQERMDQYVNNTLSQVKDPRTRQRLAERLTADVVTTRERVIKHELDQDRADKINTFDAGIGVALTQAQKALNADELQIQINNALVAQEGKNKVAGVDALTAEMEKKKTAANVVESAVLGSIANDRTGTMARDFLEKFSDQIEPTDKMAIQRKLDDQMQILALEKEQELESKFIDGTLTQAEIREWSMARKNGGIGASKAKTLIRQLETSQSKKIKSFEDRTNYKGAERYLELVNTVLADDVARFNTKQLLIDAMADGYVSQAEAKRLDVFKQKLEGLAANPEKMGVIDSAMRYVIVGLNELRTDKRPENHSAVGVQKLIQAVMSGGDINTDKEEVMTMAQDIVNDEKVKANPRMAQYPIGTIVQTPVGPAKVVGYFPDGEPDVELLNR